MKNRKIHIIYLVLAIVLVLGGIGFYFLQKSQNKKDYEGPVSLEHEIISMEDHIQRNPDDIDTMWELAERYSRVDRDYDRAHELLSSILEIEPKHELTLHLKGLVYIEQGKFIEALTQFEKKLSVDERDPVTLHKISQLYFIMDGQKALEYAKKATEAEQWIYSQDSQHVYSPMFSQWEEAIVDFETKFQEDPVLAVLNMEEHFLVEPALMLEVCKLGLKEIEMSSEQSGQRLLEMMGLLYTQLDMNRDAVDVYEQLVELRPSYGRGYILLANRLARLNDFESLKSLNDKIQLQPKLELEKNIVDILLQYHNGEVEEAIERLQVMSVSDYNILISHNMGILYEGIGDRKKAISSYNKALSYSDEEYEFWRAIDYETTRAILKLEY